MNADSDALRAAYETCEANLRGGAEADRDHWLACLFAPAESRPHLHALYAFAREAARVPEIVSQPALGEIRLQWWIEALEGQRAGEAAAHPVAAALLDTIARFNLPSSALIALLEVRRFDLYADPMPSLNDLEGYCGETCSALLRLAALIVAGGRDPGGADAAGHAGVALGLARILVDLPHHAARGACYLPADVLRRHRALPEAAAAGVSSPALAKTVAELRAHARSHIAKAWDCAASMEASARVALLPLALAEPLLRWSQRRDPFSARPPLAQWRRQWSLWRAARRL